MADHNLFVACMAVAAFLGACAGYFIGIREREMVRIADVDEYGGITPDKPWPRK